MARGRKAVVTDTTPGKVLLLALLAAAPVALAFVFAPLATGGATTPTFLRLVLFGTPVLAAWSLVLYVRAHPGRRAHRAARIGLLLDGVCLFLWLLVVASLLFGPASRA
ncbi:MAG TPA: hypothetical protein VHH36_05535 [Candidatus Thermoplasmatota archaeon]|nr:hypothetical protein [Candidatus Thermoplasmatota archaeon]